MMSRRRPDPPPAAAWCALAAGGGEAERADDPEMRCDCGSLLARWSPQGVEVKCRRCKRRVILPIQPGRRHKPPL